MQYGFGSGSAWAVLSQFVDGSTPSNPTIVKLGVLQEWSMDIQWDTKGLYGTYDSPIVVARGKAKYPLKMKFAQFNANLLQGLVFGQLSQPAAGETLMSEDQVGTITAGSIAITPPGSGTFVADWGVRYKNSGLVLTKVASAPTVGQYSVSGSTYTFNTGENNTQVLISYEYTVTGGYTLTVNRQLLGSLPVFKFFGKVIGGANQFTLKMNQVVSSKLAFGTKLDDFTLPEIDAEAFADASGTVMSLSMVEL